MKKFNMIYESIMNDLKEFKTYEEFKNKILQLTDKCAEYQDPNCEEVRELHNEIDKIRNQNDEFDKKLTDQLL